MMQIKICGMKYPDNIRDTAKLNPDFIGFVFNPKSSRYAEPLDASALAALPHSIQKVGVFANEELEDILTIIYKYKLDAAELHGFNNVSLCKKIREEAKVMVIKAFPIMSAYNLKVTKEYEKVSDIFLFDTKTDIYGDAKQKFNLNILHQYADNVPFLLGGEIGMDDLKTIRKFEHPKMAGLNLNSQFETAPGRKNVSLLASFIEELNQPQQEEKGGNDEEKDENK